MKKELLVNRRKSKQVANRIKTIIDKDTGEVIEQEVEKVFNTVVKTDNFYMCFFENMAGFYGLKHASDIKLLTAMCEIAEFNTGIVQITTAVRKRLADKANISLTNMSKNLRRLLDADLVSGKDGEYRINPAVFWKGTTQERVDIIKEGGITFKVKLVDTL